MLRNPRWILHLEGATIFVLALYFYGTRHYPWWLFAVFFLVPDVSMLGYLMDVNWGSAIYNLVHTVTLPLLALGAALLFAATQYVPFALIWLAHIGFDRALGFGLKYPTFFKDTHLQRL